MTSCSSGKRRWSSVIQRWRDSVGLRPCPPQWETHCLCHHVCRQKLWVIKNENQQHECRVNASCLSSFQAEPVSNNMLVVAEFNLYLTYGYSNSYEITWNEGVCQVEDSCSPTTEPTTQAPEPPTDVVISTGKLQYCTSFAALENQS